jgi:hypothetical protein
VVFETSGCDDGVQEEMAKAMVCRTQTFASWNSGERRMEVRDPSVMSWARACATSTGRDRG